MTSQIRDKIYVDGKWHDLACEPLSIYIEEKKGSIPELEMQSTACWRGYVASWKIIGDELYLTSISDFLPDRRGLSIRKFFPAAKRGGLSIRTIFPDAKRRVFAIWVTGDLYIPMGKLLTYVHSGYESVFERDLIISIEKGKITGRKIVENSPDNRQFFYDL